MRVLLYSPVHVSGSVEGITKNVQYMLNGLQGQGIEASLLTPTQSPLQMSLPFNTVLRGIELAKLLRERTAQADIFHVNLQNASQSLVLRGIPLPKSRLVCSVWSSYVEFDEVMRIVRNAGYSAGLIAEHLPHMILNTRLTASVGLSKVRTFVASCKFIEKRINALRLSGPHVQVIPNGVDVNDYRSPRDSEKAEVRETLGIAPEQKVVLYYGHTTRTRGVDYLIQAMSLVFKTLSNVVLLIAESGLRSFDLKRQIHEARMAEKTILLGRVNVPRILFAADVAVLPLISHVGSIMIPNTLLEMMAAGLPVVTTTIGAMPEVVTHNKTGVLVEPYRPTDLAQAIIMLLSDDQMRRELGQAACGLMKEKYNWDASIKKLIQLYRHVQDRDF